jgi:hypothetical protein
MDARALSNRPIDEQLAERRRAPLAPLFLALSVLAGLASMLAARQGSARSMWERVGGLLAPKPFSLPASSGDFSKQPHGSLGRLSAQSQAEVLLDGTIHHYDGALEELSAREASWRGRLKMDAQLTSLLGTALNSEDLRVRGAAIETELVAYNLAKTNASAEGLITRIKNEPQARPWALWMLGAMGNRGVETDRVMQTLVTYTHDADEKTRYWAVEGLSLVGTDATIEPLLDVFRHDASWHVRQVAGAGLAQSGMLTKEQRMKAVPALIDYAGDASLDANTRPWVYRALREITGANPGSDAAAWRKWWAENSSRRAG